MNILTNNYQNYDLPNNSSKPAFKGDLGRQFVKEIENGKDIKPEQIVDAVKGTFGLNTDKVKDVLDELRSRATILIHKEQNVDANTKYYEKQIADMTERNARVAERTEIETVKNIKKDLKLQEEKINEKETKIRELNEFSAQYRALKPISFDEAKILTPEETINTIISMSENAKSAHEDMLNFLFTGKGGQEAIKYTNQGTELWKTYSDGVFNIPEVNEVHKQHKGQRISSPESTLVELMTNALFANPKGGYIHSTSISKQVKKNAIAILSTISDSPKEAEKTVDKILNDVKTKQTNLSNAKYFMSKKHPDRTYIFNPRDYHNASVTEYIGNEEHNSWHYNEFSYYFGRNY